MSAPAPDSRSHDDGTRRTVPDTADGTARASPSQSDLLPGHQSWSSVTHFVSTAASSEAPTGFIRLRGEIDLAAAPDVREVVRRAVEEGVADVTLDLSGVSFLDVTGVNALSWCREHVEASGSRLRIGQVSHQAAFVLSLTGMP